MTDAELIRIATRALPNPMRNLQGTIVRRTGPGDPAQPFALEAMSEDDKLLGELEKLLDTKLPRMPVDGNDNVDVAFHQDTALGRRTTVIQIRGGKVSRKIGQA